jgi:hypothetical protein
MSFFVFFVFVFVFFLASISKLYRKRRKHGTGNGSIIVPYSLIGCLEVYVTIRIIILRRIGGVGGGGISVAVVVVVLVERNCQSIIGGIRNGKCTTDTLE